MTKQENITRLYNQLTIAGSKEKVTMAIADSSGLTYDSVKSNWIAKGKVPDKHQDTVVGILQNAVRFQNEYINNININL